VKGVAARRIGMPQGAGRAYALRYNGLDNVFGAAISSPRLFSHFQFRNFSSAIVTTRIFTTAIFISLSRLFRKTRGMRLTLGKA
jgi:hypothetical protein